LMEIHIGGMLKNTFMKFRKD